MVSGDEDGGARGMELAVGERVRRRAGMAIFASLAVAGVVYGLSCRGLW